MVSRQFFRSYFYDILLEKTIRGGLLLALPFIIAGTAALTLISVPIPVYHEWIAALLDGRVYAVLTAINAYTIQMIPLILLFTMSFSFGKAVCKDEAEILYYPIATFCAYLIFLSRGALTMEAMFGTTQTFLSIAITLISCNGLLFFSRCKFADLRNYIPLPGNQFSVVYRMAFPCTAVLLVFASANLFFTPNIQDIAANFHLRLFSSLGDGFFSAFLYILLEHFYWFIGVHGGNILDVVSLHLMEPRILLNAELSERVQIYSKTFMDAFVTYGGCGSALSLTAAAYFFGERPHTRHIAKLSAPPCLFNVSEIVVLGLPVICNPVFFIPFLLVPLVNLSLSSFAIQSGLVPAVAHSVEWTTPFLLSGYLATESISGSLLQVVTFILGVYIYKPFIKRYERMEERIFKREFDLLVAETAACEKAGKTPTLLSGHSFSEVANTLADDLLDAMRDEKLELYYQPQVQYDGEVYGAEALLRWNHPQAGFVYPPLLIFLASERGFLDELGLYVIERSCRDLQYMVERLPRPIKISVNLSPVQLDQPIFCDQIRSLLAKYDFAESTMAFELTEQVALMDTAEINERLNQIKEMGILLSMDDFGMGHSSVMYLQESVFDIVKLDGNLVKKILTSERSVDIIRAIDQLALKFNLKVIAEYVETAEQRDLLASLGCYIYQGWLYCKAVPLDDAVAFIKQNQKNI